MHMVYQTVTQELSELSQGISGCGWSAWNSSQVRKPTSFICRSDATYTEQGFILKNGQGGGGGGGKMILMKKKWGVKSSAHDSAPSRGVWGHAPPEHF